jgi:rubrerythrin
MYHTRAQYKAYHKLIHGCDGDATMANLETAIAGEHYEHEREYAALKEALIADGFFASEEDEIWVCEVCGHIHRGKKAPVACPLCKAGREYFKREYLN